MLTDAQVERFSRHIVLPEVGARGQQRLLAASVVIIGGGAAAGETALALERAGLGRVRIIAPPAAEAEEWQAADLVLCLHEAGERSARQVTADERTLFLRCAETATPLLFGSTEAGGMVRIGTTPLASASQAVEEHPAIVAASTSFLAAEAALLSLRFLLGLGSLPEAVGYDLLAGNLGTHSIVNH